MRDQGSWRRRRISIIIPTFKSENEILTIRSLKHCPVSYQLILSRKSGLGYARNFGARQAKCDLLVFLDDDLILKPEIWEKILATPKGEFKMTKYYDLPCTRVMAIHAEDFWRVGGFDESIKFIGEDVIFYFEAIQHGLKFSKIPIELVAHIQHVKRCDNKHVAISMIVESCRIFVYYGIRYLSLKVFLESFVMGEMRLRSFVIRLVALSYYIFKVNFIAFIERLAKYFKRLTL